LREGLHAPVFGSWWGASKWHASCIGLRELTTTTTTTTTTARTTTKTKTMLYRYPLFATLLIFTSASPVQAQGTRVHLRERAHPSSREHMMPAQLRVRPRCPEGKGRASRRSTSGDVEVCHNAPIKLVSAASIPKRANAPGPTRPRLGGRNGSGPAMERGRSSRGSAPANAPKSQRETHRSRAKVSTGRSFLYRNGVRPHLASATLDPLPFSEGDATQPSDMSATSRGSFGPIFVVARVVKVTRRASAYRQRQARSVQKFARRSARVRRHKSSAKRVGPRLRQP
jgi:hypothetical protein